MDFIYLSGAFLVVFLIVMGVTVTPNGKGSTMIIPSWIANDVDIFKGAVQRILYILA